MTVSNQKNTLQMSPLFHIAGLVTKTAASLTAGVKLFNLTKFNPATFLPYIKEKKVRSTNSISDLNLAIIN